MKTANSTRYKTDQKLWSVVFCLLFTTGSFSQNNGIDSLHDVLEITREDTNKVNVLNKLSLEYKKIAEYEKMKKYAEEARLLAVKISFVDGKANAYNNIGLFYQQMNNYASAMENYQ